MRKTELLIAAAALLVISVSATLYVVNHPSRVNKPGVLAQAEPEQVISPGELLGPPTPDGSDDGDAPSVDDITTISIDVAPAPNRTRAGAPRALYPAWQSGQAQVEEARAVTKPNGYIAPKWSPVGLDLAFTREDLTGLYLGAPNPGGAIRQLMLDPKAGEQFHWNPDGMSLQVLALDGRTDQLTITGERLPAEPRPERVVEREDKIYYQASPARGREGEVLISGPEDRFRSPVLSPDESKVVFRGAETGLYIATVDGNRVLSVGPGSNPSWLADSSGIVYDQPVSDGRTLVDGDLWLALADGSFRVNLTNTPAVVETHPAVAPDGERIAFSAAGTIYVGKLARPR